MTEGLSSITFERSRSPCGTRPRPPLGLPICSQQDAVVEVAARQAAAKTGDGGVVVGELLCRSPAPCGPRPPPPTPCPCSTAVAERCGGIARHTRNPTTEGFSSTTLLRSPVPCGTRPPRRLAYPSATAQGRRCSGYAQAEAEFGDGGVVVGQLLPDRQRHAEFGLRLR